MADRLVKVVDQGIADDGMVADPCGEADFIAALSVLLVLEPCRVGPDRFASWRERFHKLQTEAKPGDGADLRPRRVRTFFARYNGCLDQALQIGIDRFSAAT